jgi:hypothetical protein
MSEFSNEYRVGNSPTYALFSIFLHGGAAAMLLLTAFAATFSMPGVAFVVLAWLALGVGALRDLRSSGHWRGRNAIAQISISNPRSASQRASWRLCRRSGQSFGPALVTGGRVMDCAIWLHLRDEPGRRAVICVPADAMSAAMFRRLRVAACKALGQ